MYTGYRRSKSRREQAAQSFPDKDAGDKELAKWFREHRVLLEDILLNRPGFKVHSRGGKIHFQVGHQGFTLDFSPENNGERTWMSQMLERALDRLEGSRPDEFIDVCDEGWLRVRSWAMDGMKKPPELAFTAGAERNVARLLWELSQNS